MSQKEHHRVSGNGDVVAVGTLAGAESGDGVLTTGELFKGSLYWRKCRAR